MSAEQVLQRLRARAAASPRLRRLLGRAPRAGSGRVNGANASTRAVGSEALAPTRARYDSFRPAPISYGTVRDFADSTDALPGLAGANFDMKDMQRCWMVKAVLGTVPRGGRLVEIGAGEPLVAGLFSRLGYEVVVVDPYDGSGNGPRQYEQFRRDYPDVRFIREQFPPSEDLGGNLDCVYSISVLEHVPLEALDAVTANARELLRERGGCSIHAVDHVVVGWSAEEHLEKLRRIATGMGLSSDELDATLARLTDDPETYFVSAESHNRWRGELPYDEYAMRRIVSVNLCARAS